MFKTDKKPKYRVVDNTDEPETLDLEPMKRKICSPTCLWSSLFTGCLIGLYYIPSVTLTFYQNWLYKSFKFPLITVIIHMCVKFLLAAFIRVVFFKKQNKQNVSYGWKEYLLAVGTTGVFSGIDISFSNWALELITVSLYTMTKSTTIVFILIFAIILKLEKKSWSLCCIVLMITVGLILFTYKSTQFNILGFTLLLLASVASGIRWTCVQLLLQKSKMGMNNPVDMIYHMQPWMLLSVLPFAIYIEGPNAIKNCHLWGCDDSANFIRQFLKILLGAFIAFFMEFTEVTVVTYTSSLTLAIAGIFKEVLQLVIAVEWNHDQLSPLNIAGLVTCLCGISFHVFHKIKNQPLRPRPYEKSVESNDMGEYLIKEDMHESPSESEDERSDTEVLFDILNRRRSSR
ncbi:solute carrier family 35 member C2 isoform X1 [Diabrotica virgifera virgifera]|uniref:Sugar phosphate transporter domain-containing protein n=2 Tax=Diabrotica virgifera virgifera TaxID=50390 RepID=A0ABM5KTT4_DIAVI|nr:solute carrier family 35 member C2 isoform X1 [Diabrotica virgifera virgifera]